MREAKRCDACGIMGRHWQPVAVMQDGQLAHSWTLCLACASDLDDAVRRHIEQERKLRRAIAAAHR